MGGRPRDTDGTEGDRRRQHGHRSMDFVPTTSGGRVAAALSAGLLGRNAIAEGERLRRMIKAAEESVPPQT